MKISILIGNQDLIPVLRIGREFRSLSVISEPHDSWSHIVHVEGDDKEVLRLVYNIARRNIPASFHETKTL